MLQTPNPHSQPPMVSQEPLQPPSISIPEPVSGPRISFSGDFLDDDNFISICPHRPDPPPEKLTKPTRTPDFEFLSGNSTNMITADELFSEGKLLPFWQAQQAEKLSKISLKTENHEEGPQEKELNNNKDDSRISWFLDDDPSPRPPKCTVLWKELLRLRKQRNVSSLSPSSSSSSSSSERSLAEISSGDREKKDGDREKMVKRVKKRLERTRSTNIRIRPVINVPICTTGKNTGLPPLFTLRKGRLEH